jgi:hypothetical protein
LPLANRDFADEKQPSASTAAILLEYWNIWEIRVASTSKVKNGQRRPKAQTAVQGKAMAAQIKAPHAKSPGREAVPRSQIQQATGVAVICKDDFTATQASPQNDKSKFIVSTPPALMNEQPINCEHQPNARPPTTELHRHTMDAALQTFQSLFLLPLRSVQMWQDVWFGARRPGAE